jgi:succinylarginine dihydrolase
MAELLHQPAPLSLLGSHWEGLYSAENSPIAVSLRQLGFERAQQVAVLPTFISNHRRDKKAVVLRHPLWTSNYPEVLNASEALAGIETKVVSPFMLLRRPSDAL